MDLRVRCCGLLVLSLFAVFCVSKSEEEDPCKVFDGSMIPSNMRYSAKFEDGSLTVRCWCKDGYLLVPANGSLLTCNNITGWEEVPSCQAIPKVGFTEATTECKMTEKCEDQDIVVGLTGKFVRNFTVTVELTDPTDPEMEADPDCGGEKPFSLVTTSLLFNGSASQKLKVKVKDTEMSGVNQNYILCLRVLPSEEEGMNETRAVVVNGACTVLTVVNDNVAVVRLVQNPVMFSSKTQLISFQVGYRTCDIHMELCLEPKVDDIENSERKREASVCHSFYILDKESEFYVVDLVKKNAAFSLEVGQHTGVLSVLDSDGCGANVVNPNLTVIWTLAPEEILENSGVLLLEDKYTIDVDLRDSISDIFITVSCSSCVAIPVNISFYPQGGSPDLLTFSMMAAIDSVETEVDISDFVKQRITEADVLVEKFTISLSVQTSPLLARVDDSSKVAPLTLSLIGASVGFSSNSTLMKKQNKTDISISTSQTIRNLNDYVSVSVVDDQQSELEAEYSLSWLSGHSWSLTLKLTAEFEKLGVYTLSLEEKNADAEVFDLEFDEEPAFVTIGVHLEFEKTQYTFEEGQKDLEIVIMSSRQLGENELKKFLKFESDKILTMNGDVKWENGKLSVTLTKKNESVTGVDVSVTLTGEEQYVEIPDDSAATTVSIPSPPTTPASTVPIEEESDKGDVGEAVDVGTSWSFGGMIAVLIAAVVVAVVVYVGYSNRQKILSYVGGGGEEGGGGKSIISKARKRLRSRGAYKKLPTSVQDAMTRHND